MRGGGLLLACFFLAVAGKCFAKDVFSMTAFADYLFLQRRYAQAQLEYERALFLNPSLASDPRVTEKILESLILCGRPQGALARAEEFLAGGAMGEVGCVAQFYKARALFDLGNFSSAAGFFSAMAGGCREPYAGHGWYWSGLAHLHLGEYAETSMDFGKVPLESVLSMRAEEGKVKALDGDALTTRSPLRAGVLNIFPGTGYLYTWHPQTALTSFLVTGLFAWGTTAALHAENDGLAVVLGLFTATWYFGGIHGAAQSAKRFNEGTQQAFVKSFYHP